MSQNTLIEKIKKDGEAAVAEIMAAGQAEVDSIQRETDESVVALVEAHKISLEKKLAQMELVALAKAKQEGNIAVQRAKRDEIDGLFAEVVSELESQNETEYVSFFKKFAEEIIPHGAKVEHVHAPAKRVEETESILKKLSLEGKVVKDNALKAGFILHTDDGVYDVTLNRLLAEKMSELEASVFSKLVG